MWPHPWTSLGYSCTLGGARWAEPPGRNPSCRLHIPPEFSELHRCIHLWWGKHSIGPPGRWTIKPDIPHSVKSVVSLKARTDPQVGRIKESVQGKPFSVTGRRGKKRWRFTYCSFMASHSPVVVQLVGSGNEGCGEFVGRWDSSEC